MTAILDTKAAATVNEDRGLILELGSRALDVGQVARRNLYFDDIRKTATYQQLSMAIERFRANLPKIRPWTAIPC
jgi:hypothetical protein